MIRAWPGEFGLKVRYFVPQVHAMLAAGSQVVEIERGEEALFPRALAYSIRERGIDMKRRGRPPRMFWREERFVPEPLVSHGVRCDVVICPRKRDYGSEKNWPHWFMLSALPNVFAAGAPDSSYNVDCPRAWDYERFLDASIEAMRSAKLVVATDAGLAHLAVLVGAPLLLITHNGRVAPGPVRDARGRMMRSQYWPVRFSEYYERANHTGASIRMIDGWTNPNTVLDAVMEVVPT